MSAKRPNPACQPVYDAADLWIDRALRSDDSLFTPGTPIWSKDNLRETRARFVGKVGEWKSEDVLNELEKALADSPPEVYQLVGEAAYVAYLIIHKSRIKRPRKKDVINQILRWSSPKPVEIPPCLLDGLEYGIVDPGYNVDFKRRLSTVITFAEGWKCGGSDAMLKRSHPEYPRRFQEFLKDLKLSGAQQMPLLHLVHPDSFEPLVWQYKVEVAEAPKFHDCVAMVPGEEVNRRIHRIRAALEPKYGVGFHFRDHPEVCRMWSDKCKDENNPADC